jgi:selenocysteine-specific elongation factor
VVAVERERYFTPRALEQFTAGLLAVLAGGPITPARVRDQIGVSRKYLIPLLEWADQAGLTIRRGEGRVAGTQLRGPPGG